jgi:hypothetical protein
MPALALALSLAFAAGPPFSEVVKRVKPLALPLSSTALEAPKGALTAADLKALGLAKNERGELAEFARWLKPPERGSGEKSAARVVGAIARATHTVLVVSVEYEGPAAKVLQTYLVSYSPQGELLDALRFSTALSSEAGETDEVSTLTAEGGLGRRKTMKIPMMEAGLPEQLTVVSDQVGKLTARGTFELAPLDYRTRDGAFVDPKTKEELRVFGADVFYRGNESKPFRFLLREGDTVRFKPGGDAYALSWNEKRTVVRCNAADGSTQAFERTW